MIRRAQLPPARASHPPAEGRTADRVMTIMEVLVNASDGLRLSEVARRSHLPKSSTARALADLVRLGIVARIQERYLPGTRTLALAAHVGSLQALARRSIVMPSLLRLREETGLAAAFSTLRYGQVYMESVLYVSGRVDQTSTTPLWVPAHCTSSGKALLAHSPATARRVIEDRGLSAFTPYTIIDPDRLEAELAEVRHHGVAHNDREYLSDISSAAVPVVDTHLGLVGALAVCGSQREIARSVVGAALRRAAWTSIVAMRRRANSICHH